MNSYIQQIAEIKTALIGIDGKNGLRGEIKELAACLAETNERLLELEKQWKEYMLHDREVTCYGLAALKEHQKTIEEKKEETLDYKKAIVTSRISVIGMIVVAILSNIDKIMRLFL